MSQNNGYRNRLVNGRGFDRDLEYVHQEYPKLVDGPDGERVTVNSEEEENALLAASVSANKKSKSADSLE